MDHDTIINALTDKVKRQDKLLNAIGARLVILRDNLYTAETGLYNAKVPINRDDNREHCKSIALVREQMTKALVDFFDHTVEDD
jgi:hypothetical protein